MKYISGWHALNLENSLDTCGDWHTSALRWGNPTVYESNESIYKDWGIEENKKIPEHSGSYNVANDIRVILDFFEKGNFIGLKGFYNDFFCTDKYNDIFFEKVYMLRNNDNWSIIDGLMSKEFMWNWDNYLISKGYDCNRLKNRTPSVKGDLISLKSKLSKEDLEKWYNENKGNLQEVGNLKESSSKKLLGSILRPIKDINIVDFADIVRIYVLFKDTKDIKNIKNILTDAIGFVGIEYYDYLYETQKNLLNNNENFLYMFLYMWYDLNLR